MEAENLWHGFPKTLIEFEQRFPDEETCREYLIELRWEGQVRCRKCGHSETWELENGRFECVKCGFQTSVTAGTLFHGTRKPLRLWFRAMWEMSARKSGINACELQRLLGFGSYKTAWCWLHKLRRAIAGREKTKLTGEVVANECYVGAPGKIRGRGTTKQLVLVAAEIAGRARLEPAPGADAENIRAFLDRSIAANASLCTDGWKAYCPSSVGSRDHEATPANSTHQPDSVAMCHLVTALFKRTWIGTFHGAISRQHLLAYLDGFAFRFNRRKTHGIGRLTARLIAFAAAAPPIKNSAISSSPIPVGFSLT